MEFVLACAVKAGRPVDAVLDRLSAHVEGLLVQPGETVTARRLDRCLVLAVDRDDKPYRDQWVEFGSGRLFGLRGYTTMPRFTVEGFESLVAGRRRLGIRRGSQEFRLTSSPGGLYSAIVVSNGEPGLRAWASHGNVEALLYAEHADAWIVGTNPLAVHVAAQRDGRVRLVEDWARRVIVSASTMHDDTPFLGTRYVPSRRALTISRDRVEFEEHPVALSVSPEDASLDEVFAEAQRSVSPCTDLPDPKVSLSGGKDSRAALAAALAAGLGVRTFTSGVEGSGEVDVARRVARAVGVDHEMVERDTIDPSELWDTVRANVREADGLLSENRHLVFPVRHPSSYSVEVHGQAHHLRGGYMTRGRYSPESLVERIARPFSSGRAYCPPELGDDVDRAVGEYLARPDVGSNGLQLYWIYGDLRMARWLQAGFGKLRTTKLLIWPFLDERMLEVTARLSRHDRIHEIAEYELIARGAPAAAALPLFQSTWRFDRRQLSAQVHPQWAVSRSQPVQHGALRPRKRPPANTIEMVVPYVREGLASTPIGSTIRGWLTPEMNAVVDGGPVAAVAEINGPFRLYSFLWRLVGLVAVYEGGWLPSPLELATDASTTSLWQARTDGEEHR